MTSKNKKAFWISSFSLAFLVFVFTPAQASERLCDGSFEDCRAPLVTLIQNENVQIDIAFWFLDDYLIENALISKIKAGVKVRMLVDPRADDSHAPNTAILQQLATMVPAVPMRKRVEDGILHWKMALFAGQGIVEFSGANLSRAEMDPYTPYVNYVDEAIFFSDDSSIVNSFRTMYDKWWVDTVNFADYANTSGMVLTPSYATYPIESEVCSAVPDGCGMNFLPSSRWQDNYGTKVEDAINAEKAQLDVDMFRITNAPIANSMIAAHQRGVPIRMIVDTSEYLNTARVWDRYNVDRMFMAGIPLKITKHAGQNHEKSVLVYGQGLAIWGSSNWTSPSFNSQQEHNYFATYTVKPWYFQWFVNQFERRWNSAQEYAAFVPVGPSVPVYKSPANAATGQSQHVTLSWDGGPWGQQYDIYVSAAINPTLIASNVVTGAPDPPPQHGLGSFKLSGLAPNTTYHWKIVSKTMANLINSGPIWSFTTGGTAPSSGATVTSLSPATGPAAGGTAVQITGTNFEPGATVSFGLSAAAKVVVVNSTTITATTPPQVGGSSKITVTNPDGTSGSLAGGFVYTSIPPSTQPVLNVVVPNSGTPEGGTPITVSGHNFAVGVTVTIGGAPATVTNRGLSSLTVTTPAGTAGTQADVVVTNPNNPPVTLKAAYSYVNPWGPPLPATVSPTSGSYGGGTRLVVGGTGFQFGAVVSFGGQPPPVGTGTLATTITVTNSATACGSGVPVPCIIATTPPHAVGAADVVVTNMNPATGVIDSGSGTNRLTAGYTFVLAPLISALSPSSGTVAGGTQFSIAGKNFESGAAVYVNNEQATIVSSGSSSITVTAPPNTAGTSAVTVVNPDGQKSNTLIFTYQ